VGIGGALAEARSEAGLTITQVSERTRIRETIIRDIERDDYSACGGDFYTRGHIRAIARAVGTDPVPLIEEYDGAGVAAGDGGDAPGGIGPAGVDPDADTSPGLFNGDSLEFDLPGRLWPETRLLARRWVATIRSRLAGAAPGRTAGGVTGTAAGPNMVSSVKVTENGNVNRCGPGGRDGSCAMTGPANAKLIPDVIGQVTSGTTGGLASCAADAMPSSAGV